MDEVHSHGVGSRFRNVINELISRSLKLVAKVIQGPFFNLKCQVMNPTFLAINNELSNGPFAPRRLSELYIGRWLGYPSAVNRQKVRHDLLLDDFFLRDRLNSQNRKKFF